jgi:hypothetical protein
MAWQRQSEGAGRTSRRIRHCLCSNPENARRAAQSGNGPAVTATSATFMDGLCASMCAPGKTASKQSWLQDSFQVEYHGDLPFLFQEKVIRRKHFVWPQEKKVKTSWAPNFFYWTGGLVVRSPLGWAGLGWVTPPTSMAPSIIDFTFLYWTVRMSIGVGLYFKGYG